jgi:hypothetical protein
LIISAGRKRQLVMQRNGLQNGAHFVVSIRPFAEYSQAPIDFCERREREFRRFHLIAAEAFLESVSRPLRREMMRPLTRDKNLSQEDSTVGRNKRADRRPLKTSVQNIRAMARRRHPSFNGKRARIIVALIIRNVFAE